MSTLPRDALRGMRGRCGLTLGWRAVGLVNLGERMLDILLCDSTALAINCILVKTVSFTYVFLTLLDICFLLALVSNPRLVYLYHISCYPAIIVHNGVSDSG